MSHTQIVHLIPVVHLILVNWRPRSAIHLSRTGKKQRKPAASASLTLRTGRCQLRIEQLLCQFLPHSPCTKGKTVESMPTRTNTPSCQGSAYRAFFLSVNGQSRRHHANMAASQ